MARLSVYLTGIVPRDHGCVKARGTELYRTILTTLNGNSYFSRYTIDGVEESAYLFICLFGSSNRPPVAVTL